MATKLIPFPAPKTSPEGAGPTYADVVLLTRWMADQGCTAGELADAVEKPWKYDDWLELARRGADLPEDL